MAGILAGKTAFITGGGGGIGSASARLFARDGAAVMLMGRKQETLGAARAEILSEFPDARIETYSGDALSTEDVQEGLARAAAIQGGLDILVPTVGGGGFMPILMHTADTFREQLDMNVISCFLVVRYGVPLMKSGGAVVCISSTAAVMPFPWLGAYCASKGAVEQFVRTAADELAPAGVRVNAVRPGMTRTNVTGAMFDNDAVIAPFIEQMPLGRAGVPDDIAQGVRFLAGPESGWMTGQSFAVDGGHELRRNPDMTATARAMFGNDVIDAVQRGEAPQTGEVRARTGAEAGVA
ncbi:SDR family NAD(P)-dependent oxidoreductase [Sphingomonas jatrophae]|uniref:NAD(P)-dependent dehydrogenase, short-chain alcohol dehydrogenase family n=1 Tax=Sphingomonas jatrophae TaxID=1166337 RepID=A0A1I6KFX5_9SPHN|nr:SDR family oxidoreductase [Sphingomonas jatrophae]SFR90145.1 NAD(P)-dependent dehydrogenase, short-chain alcohol dehydrogenase family [Sphingomonas jatrophae]